MESSNNEPTRGQNKLDYIIASSNLKCQQRVDDSIGNSDHKTIISKIYMQKEVKKKQIKVYSTKKAKEKLE